MSRHLHLSAGAGRYCCQMGGRGQKLLSPAGVLRKVGCKRLCKQRGASINDEYINDTPLGGNQKDWEMKCILDHDLLLMELIKTNSLALPRQCEQ